MNADLLRAALLKLPHVTESLQWGDNLVFWVGDKAIGGRMFALVDLGGAQRGVISYAAGKERFDELLELDGISPAPYLARAHWVAVANWSVFGHTQWIAELTTAHQIVLNRLTPRTRRTLALPTAELRQAIAAGRLAAASKKTAG